MVSAVISGALMVVALFMLTWYDSYSFLGLLGMFIFLVGFTGLGIWLSNYLGNIEA